MVPNWYGVNDTGVKKAEMIAGRDYVILLTDLYGQHVRPTSDARAAARSHRLMRDWLGCTFAAMD